MSLVYEAWCTNTSCAASSEPHQRIPLREVAPGVVARSALACVRCLHTMQADIRTVDDPPDDAQGRMERAELASNVMSEHREAFCWQQPPGRFVACDRVAHHLGRHSWESV